MSGGRRLAIAAADLELLEREARARYPAECCGILIGEAGGDRQRRVRIVEVVATPNLEQRRPDRYTIDPRDLLAAHKRARREGRAVVGYYHSHPERPAVPSEVDRAAAWPDTSYLILEVRRGGGFAARSWRLEPGGRGFVEERVELA